MEDINKQSSKRKKVRNWRVKRNRDQKRFSNQADNKLTRESSPHNRSIKSNKNILTEGEICEEHGSSFSLKPPESLSCLICNEPIKDMYTSIEYGDKDDPAHFECTVTLLSKQESLDERDRICYMGNGSFGIIEIQRRRRRGKSYDRIVTIKKRIQVVNSDSRPPWRTELIAIKPSVRSV